MSMAITIVVVVVVVGVSSQGYILKYLYLYVRIYTFDYICTPVVVLIFDMCSFMKSFALIISYSWTFQQLY